MKKTKLALIVFFMIIIVLTFLFFSEDEKSDIQIEPIDSPELPSRGFYMGILPNIPQENEIEKGYATVSNYADFVPVWPTGTGASGFWDYSDRLDGWWGRTFLEDYIRGNEMFPIIHFSFIDRDRSTGKMILDSPERMEHATLKDEQWRSLYKRSVIDVVRVAKPLYLSVANEVNRWYEKYGADEGDPNGFQHFVSLYEEIYRKVKEISPKTKVFCVFSREIVGKDREADLKVLNMFEPDTLDLLVFTSYPFSVRGINDPVDIPDNYYSRIPQGLEDKPFGFSELGWPSLEPFGGEEGQERFLRDITNRLTVEQGLNLNLMAYVWLYDVNEGNETGLIEGDGTEKLGFGTWKKIYNLEK